MSNARFIPMSIKTIGISDGGVAIAERLYTHRFSGVDFVVAHQDRAVLAGCGVSTQIHLAGEKTVSRVAEELRRALAGADTVFVLADENDDTGITPLIGDIAQDMRVLTTGIVTWPSLKFAGAWPPAEERGLSFLRQGVDTLLVVPDDSGIPGLLNALGA